MQESSANVSSKLRGRCWVGIPVDTDLPYRPPLCMYAGDARIMHVRFRASTVRMSPRWAEAMCST
jgi:hypothetical protein